MAGHDTCCRRRVIFTMAGPVPGPGPSRKEGTRLCAALDYADGISARGVSFVLRALNCWLGKKKLRNAASRRGAQCSQAAGCARPLRPTRSTHDKRSRPRGDCAAQLGDADLGPNPNTPTTTEAFWKATWSRPASSVDFRAALFINCTPTWRLEWALLWFWPRKEKT